MTKGEPNIFNIVSFINTFYLSKHHQITSQDFFPPLKFCLVQICHMLSSYFQANYQLPRVRVPEKNSLIFPETIQIKVSSVFPNRKLANGWFLPQPRLHFHPSFQLFRKGWYLSCFLLFCLHQTYFEVKLKFNGHVCEHACNNHWLITSFQKNWQKYGCLSPPHP